MERPQGVSIEKWVEEKLKEGSLTSVGKMKRVVHLLDERDYYKRQLPYPGGSAYIEEISKTEREIERILAE